MQKYILILAVAFFATTRLDGQYTWTQKTSMPAARYSGCGFVINNFSYVGTGYDSNSVALDDWWQYNPVTDSWTQVADIPLGRASAYSFSINGKGYVGLGVNVVPLSDLNEYDPVTNSWSQKAPFPGTARYEGASFAIGNVGYICCGTRVNNNGPYTSQLYAYDVISNSWSVKQAYPGGVNCGTRGEAINGFGYVLSGNGTPVTFSYSSELWRYSPATNLWNPMADLPSVGRFCSSVFVLNNELIVGNGSHWPGCREDFYAFDPVTNTWDTIASMPLNEARWGAVAFSIGQNGYVASGNLSDSTILPTNSLWKLSLLTSIDETSTLHFEIYPTIATQFLKINFPNGNFQNLKISVINDQGQLCKYFIIPDGENSTTINISSLTAGIYFINVATESGKNIPVRKFFKADF